MPRVLLILPTATYRASDFLSAAEELSVEVVIASEEPQALPDQDFVLIDLHRPEWSAIQITEKAVPLDAIVPVDDAGVLAAALAARRLGLRHSAPDAVARTRNKVMMRRALGKSGIAQPSFAVAGSDDDVAAIARQLGTPCVIKPISLSGSRGVIRVDEADQASSVAERVRRIVATAGENPNAPLIVETYVPGSEIAVEAVLRDGQLQVLAVFDKPDPLEGPYFAETTYVTPSRLHPELILQATHLCRRAAAALGLTEGPIHAELRIDGDQLWFLELAARSIGGLCGRALRFGLMGTSLESLLLRHALNMPIRSMEREDVATGVMMLPIERSGTLESVEGTEEALEVEGITDLEITVPLGRWINPLPEGERYLGFLFAKGEDPYQVEDALREAEKRLEVTIKA